MKDVERVSRKGRPAFVSVFTLRYAKNDLDHIRMTAVAGLKVHKRSVRRNRVKRLIREAFRREFLDRVTPGYDIVIYAKKDLVGKTYADVATELGVALRKAGLLMQPPRNHGAKPANGT